jgi:hypothetical protein
MTSPEAAKPAPAMTGSGPHTIVGIGERDGPEAIPSGNAPQGAVYSASPIKRSRRTKAAVTSIRDAIRDILEGDHPQTVRQVFYALTVRGLIKKAEAEYQQTVIRLLVDMRETGDIPFYWIADNTRWQRKPTTYVGLDACLEATANFYRRDLWAAMPVYVEVWCEKDALAGVLVEETDPYDVPLMVARDTPRSASYTAPRRRSRPRASRRSSTTSATSIRPARTRPGTSTPSCAAMPRTRKSISSGLPSPAPRSRNGTYRHDPPRRPIRAPRSSSARPWNWTRSRRTGSGLSFANASSGTSIRNS